MYKPLTSLPEVCRDPSRILDLFGPKSQTIQSLCRRVLGKPDGVPVLGCDLEYSEKVRYVEVSTVLGVSDGFLHISVPFEDGLPYFQELIHRHPNMIYVGHAFTSADKFAFKQVGIEIPLEQIEDTIIWFYLTSAHLCKTGTKTLDGDGEKRGKGYMNLWTFLSLHTDAPNYKELFANQIEYGGKVLDVWEYNAYDSKFPLDALPSVITQAKLRGVDKLYPLHRDLAYVLREMTNFGVQVDSEYLFGNEEKGIVGLQREFEQKKEAIETTLPFNPKSGKASIAYFKAKGIELSDWQETTIREAVEDSDDPELAQCLEYKELGNGTDRWFAPVGKDKSGNWVGYMDDSGKIHPRGGMFTSTGRLQYSSPNLQNVSTRRVDRYLCECGSRIETHPTPTCSKFKGISLGKMVRRAIIASPGFYLLEGDLANAENRVFLFMGGHDIPIDVDLHNRVAEMANLTPEMEFCIVNGTPRQAAKTVQHAGNYLEGLQLKSKEELRTTRMRQEVAAGARIVYPEWTFEGQIVTFTGSNLAQRAFGDKSWKNREKALAVSEKYFGGFPGARQLQQKIMKQIETQKMVKVPHGYTLLSFGADKEERCKTAASMWGQCPIAHITKLALVDLWKKFQGGQKLRPILQVHDAIIGEVPLDVLPEVAGKWLKESMEIETPEIPGMVIPVDLKWGPNWRDLKGLKL